jgi:uncharacterized paraquat-inducible protein A
MRTSSRPTNAERVLIQANKFGHISAYDLVRKLGMQRARELGVLWAIGVREAMAEDQERCEERPVQTYVCSSCGRAPVADENDICRRCGVALEDNYVERLYGGR